MEEKVLRSGSDFTKHNTLVATLFAETYGYEEFLRLNDFLEWYDINDLHSGNIGYINGKLVFIDYAGYYA